MPDVRTRTTLLLSFPTAPLRERCWRIRTARETNSPAQSSCQVESSAASVSSFGFGGTNGCVVLRLAEKAGSRTAGMEAFMLRSKGQIVNDKLQQARRCRPLCIDLGRAPIAPPQRTEAISGIPQAVSALSGGSPATR